MAKLLQTQNEYRLYPKRSQLCNCCHREFVSEPFVFETKFYVRGVVIHKVRCWRCVRSKEAVELIYNNWPNLYIMLKGGQFYYLDFRCHLVDFFRSEAE